MSNKIKLHTDLNAYERLLSKLSGQNFCAVTLMSKLVRISVDEQGFYCAH